jgi:ribbon-helix-helix protein, copG family
MAGVRLTDEEHQLLKERATKHNLSITQAMAEAIKLLYKSWGY